jgi:hypothetical protein
MILRRCVRLLCVAGCGAALLIGVSPRADADGEGAQATSPSRFKDPDDTVFYVVFGSAWLRP